MKRILHIIFLLTLAMEMSARAWYVRTDGEDGADGRTWATAQESVRLGIDNCKAGDTLFVEAGVYHEGIVLKEGIMILGGCTADEPWSRNRDHKQKTILDGTGLGCRLISCDADLQRRTYIEDFVLQNARHGQQGGGAWLRGKVVMKHCTVRGCSGLQCGGVLIKGDLPEASAQGATIEDCTIHNCEATGHMWPDAGGVANFDGKVIHCTIANNYGDRYGGIHSESSVYACTMWGNRNEYGFVDPTNYVSDESESGESRADEGFEDHFFAQPWLDRDNEGVHGPHFIDPATFAGVPQNEAEEAILLAADYRTGQPSHRIAQMKQSARIAEGEDYTLYEKADYTVPSFVAHLVDAHAPLVAKEDPYCMVATINGDPQTRMGFCWFTNEGVEQGEVQIREQGARNKDDGQWITVPATATTTEPLHYAISSSGILKAAKMDKRTAFRYVSHKALAENLQPGTDYLYRVGFDGHWSEVGHFRTAAKEEESFSFVYMTDSHIQNKEYVDAARLCADAVARNEKKARFCVFPGDFVDTGTDNNSEWEWEQWFETVMKPVIKVMPIVPTDGNHDDSPLMNYTYHFNTDTSFNQETKVRPQFAGINYSFVYGDMQLIAFSMQDFWRGEYDMKGKKSEYLEQDLGPWMMRQTAAAKNAKWHVGLVHKNLFSGSGHQRDKETPLLRATMLPVMKACRMDLVLQGHDHCYEVIGPVDSTLYFIGATCGAKRYEPFTREEMEQNKEIHQVENYYDLFQQPLAQPGAPSYTRVTVKKDQLTLETFVVREDGRTELFNTISVSRDTGITL